MEWERAWQGYTSSCSPTFEELLQRFCRLQSASEIAVGCSRSHARASVRLSAPKRNPKCPVRRGRK